MFGLIHVADRGVLYFSSTMLLIFTAFAPGFYYHALLLGALNLLTLPYAPFSVAYQVFKVRRGCALCLIVQLVFRLEFWQFHPFLFSTPPTLRVDMGLLYPVFLGLGIPVCAWPLVRYLLQKAYGPRDSMTRPE